MGWLYLKTALLVCLVLPRISYSTPLKKRSSSSPVLSSQYPGLFEALQETHNSLANQELVPTARQNGGGGGLTTILELAVKFLPVLFKTFSSFTGGSGGSGGSLADSSSSSSTNSVDRIENIDLKDEAEDIFSWQNLITTSLKLFLTLLSSSDGIDKSDSFPTQALLGTAISAITGSTDPDEVAKMAKQATEVIGIVTTLFEALQTSFS